MSLVRVKDNSDLELAEAARIPQIFDLLVDKDLKSLEQKGILLFPPSLKQVEDLDEKQIVIKSNSRAKYQTGNLMGFVQVDQEQLVIESRFSPSGTDFFFHYMLAKVFDIPNLLDLTIDGGGGEKSYDLASIIFPVALKSALRKGVYKRYQAVKYNDSNIRGGLDLPRHVRLNIPFSGNIAYQVREFSFDNSLTQLIRHTIEFLKSKSQSSFILDAVHEEIAKIVEVTPSYRREDRLRIIQEAERFQVRHAYFQEYSFLQRICLFILRQVKQGLEKSPMKVHGILFDGSWLWEEYINTLIGEYFFHPQNKTRVGEEYLFSSEKDGKSVGIIFPDFIGRCSAVNAVADAKYKPSKNIKSPDYHQILSYMFRFEAGQGYFFYPCNVSEASEQNLRYRLNGGSMRAGNQHQSRDIFVEKVGLAIPQIVGSSAEFVQAIEQQERIFVDRVVGLQGCSLTTGGHKEPVDAQGTES